MPHPVESPCIRKEGGRMSGFSNFRVDSSGIIEILQSAAVASELNDIAENLAARANSRAAQHSDSARIAAQEGNSEFYHAHKNRKGAFTALATVSSVRGAGNYDQKKYHTLNAINH